MTVAGKSVLVTGATGFLGGALARRLAVDGALVRALARSPEKGDYLREDSRIEIVQGDILDVDRMKTMMAGCEIVFHVAAALGGDLEHQQVVNVDGTRYVMQAAVSAGVQRVVHISSVAIYGYQHSGDITEDTIPAPAHDPYTITKARAEDVVREIAGQHDLSYTIIRPGTIYGPRSGMWTKQMFKLARRKPLFFVGDGCGTMPLIYVDDVVDLCIIAATHPDAANDVFHVVNDPPPTWRDYLGRYSKAVGHQSWIGLPVLPIKGLAKIAALFAGEHSQIRDLPDLLTMFTRQFRYDMSKAHQQLGWQPSVDLDTGVQHSLAWLRSQNTLSTTTR